MTNRTVELLEEMIGATGPLTKQQKLVLRNVQALLVRAGSFAVHCETMDEDNDRDEDGVPILRPVATQVRLPVLPCE